MGEVRVWTVWSVMLPHWLRSKRVRWGTKRTSKRDDTSVRSRPANRSSVTWWKRPARVSP